MRRRTVLALLGGAAALCPLTGRTQQLRPRIYRVGVLERTPAARNVNFDTFRRALGELGYIEGENLVIEYRSSEGQTERVPELAAELVRLNPDVIVTRGTPAAIAAKEATSRIPVVIATMGNPLRVVASLAHPGGNVTGLSALVAELEGKRVELLRELIPRLARIAVVKNPDNAENADEWREAAAAAQSFGIEAELYAIRRPDDIEPALVGARHWGAGGVIVGLNGLTQANANRIAELTIRERLPTMHATREFVDAGGLVSYGVDYSSLYRRAAAFVDKILRGAKPTDLPVEQPTKFSLIVNQKTAQALGLTVPPSILARADEVIE